MKVLSTSQQEERKLISENVEFVNSVSRKWRQQGHKINKIMRVFNILTELQGDCSKTLMQTGLVHRLKRRCLQIQEQQNSPHDTICQLRRINFIHISRSLCSSVFVCT